MKKTKERYLNILIFIICLSVSILGIISSLYNMYKIHNSLIPQCEVVSGEITYISKDNTVGKAPDKNYYVSFISNNQIFNNIRIYDFDYCLRKGQKVEIYYNPYAESDRIAYLKSRIYTQDIVNMVGFFSLMVITIYVPICKKIKNKNKKMIVMKKMS